VLFVFKIIEWTIYCVEIYHTLLIWSIIFLKQEAIIYLDVE
jgi:hypothetical protein